MWQRWFEVAGSLDYMQEARSESLSVLRKGTTEGVNNASDKIKQSQQAPVPVWIDYELYP